MGASENSIAALKKASHELCLAYKICLTNLAIICNFITLLFHQFRLQNWMGKWQFQKRRKANFCAEEKT